MPWQEDHTNANRGMYWHQQQGGQAKVATQLDCKAFKIKTHICYGQKGAKQKDMQADAQRTHAKVECTSHSVRAACRTKDCSRHSGQAYHDSLADAVGNQHKGAISKCSASVRIGNTILRIICLPSCLHKADLSQAGSSRKLCSSAVVHCADDSMHVS